MRLLRKGVDNALGLVNLGLALGDAVTKGLASGSHLRTRDTEGLGNLVTSEPLALVGIEEALDGLDTSANLALLLGVTRLALLVARVKRGQEGLRLGSDLIGEVRGDDGVVELASSDGGHNASFLRVCAMALVAALFIGEHLSPSVIIV